MGEPVGKQHRRMGERADRRLGKWRAGQQAGSRMSKRLKRSALGVPRLLE